MKKNKSKSGVTLVEVMIAVMLVGVAAAIVYSEMLVSYRILMRSRARLEAQAMASDLIWLKYNLPNDEMPTSSTNELRRTDATSVLSTNGFLDYSVLVETNDVNEVVYWDFTVTVWAPTNSPLQMGTNALARYDVRRYQRDRAKK